MLHRQIFNETLNVIFILDILIHITYQLPSLNSIFFTTSLSHLYELNLYNVKTYETCSNEW